MQTWDPVMPNTIMRSVYNTICYLSDEHKYYRDICFNLLAFDLVIIIFYSSVPDSLDIRQWYVFLFNRNDKEICF